MQERTRYGDQIQVKKCCISNIYMDVTTLRFLMQVSLDDLLGYVHNHKWSWDKFSIVFPNLIVSTYGLITKGMKVCIELRFYITHELAIKLHA